MTIYRYVDRTSGNTAGGDGTTRLDQTADGSTRAFYSLSDAEASLASPTTDDVVIRVAGEVIDTSATFNGKVGSGYTITVTADRGEDDSSDGGDDGSGFDNDGFYDGPYEWSTSHYRMQSTSATTTLGFSAPYQSGSNAHHVCDGLQVATRASNTGYNAIRIFNRYIEKCTVRNCRIRVVDNASNRGIDADFAASDNTRHFDIYNNLIFGSNNVNSTGIYVLHQVGNVIGGDLNITNNTFYRLALALDINDTATDPDDNAANFRFQNNAIADISGTEQDASSFGADTETFSYNASDDSFGTNHVDISSGGTESDGWEAAWTAPTAADDAKDFSPLYDVLHAAATTGTGIPTTDFYGNSRHATAPSIGAIELKPKAGANTISLTSLSAGTDYILYSVHVDADGNISNLPAEPFTTSGGSGTEISAGVDSLTLTEYTATLNASTSISGGVDALTLTEYAATLNASTSINGSVDALTLTEYAATITASTSINGSVAALTLTEYAATINASTSIAASVDALTLTEYAASINASTNIAGGVDTLTITTHAASIQLGGDTGISAGVDNLTLTTYSATLNAETSIAGGIDSLTLTTYAATISAGTNISAAVDSLTLTTYAASISSATTISASVDNLTLTTYAASVDAGVFTSTIDGGSSVTISTNNGSLELYTSAANTYHTIEVSNFL